MAPSKSQTRKESKPARGFERLRRLASALVEEGLQPGRAAAAVFVGVFIGVVPIYGFQSLTAIGLAALFRLNKPLTFAATFVNNPLFQPWLILSSLELGHLALEGRWLRLSLTDLSRHRAVGELAFWLFGSVVLAALLGTAAALVAYAAFRIGHASARRGSIPIRKAVAGMFRQAAFYDRGFVRWKLRLDRIFQILEDELGPGPVTDLGCGYGMALALAAWQEPGRRLCGCDLDAHRIEVARQALGQFGAELSLADIRQFRFDPAAVVLILDVLQYLSREEQSAVLQRCCSSLLPGGKLIFRIPDRERGMPSRLSMALDRLVFRIGGCRSKPNVLSAADYRAILKNAGMEVRELALVNRLPLAHVVFIAVRVADAPLRSRG